jgi:hypothetical protein
MNAILPLGRTLLSKQILKSVLVVSFAILASQAQAQFRHVTLSGPNPAALPKKVVLLEPEVVVREISAGGIIEKMPDATKKAVVNMQTALTSHLAKRNEFQLVEKPVLSAEEETLMDDYAATLYQLGTTAFQKARLPGAWSVKAKEFDYTVGPGLKFLKEKTGADAALLMVGEDFVSSGGRKAMMIFAAIATQGRVIVGGGASAVFFALIDLESGNLTWLNADLSGTKDLADPKASNDMVVAALQPYPKAAAR